MPLSPALAKWLSKQGYHAIHAYHVGLSRASDLAILQRAREEGYIVITADLDFPRLLAIAHAEGPGLILLRGGQYGEHQPCALIERVLRAIAADKLIRSIVVVDHSRIRRTTLPL